MQELKAPSGIVPMVFLAHEAERRAKIRGGKPKGYAGGGSVETEYEKYMREAGNYTGNLEKGDEYAAKKFGITGPARSFDEFYGESEKYAPDRMSPAIAEMVAQQQAEYDKVKSGDKGKALMAMGLAMMQSKDPSFLGSLGAGGQAALDAREKAQFQQRQMMQGLMQAKIAQASATAQNDAARLGVATGMYGQDQNRRTAATTAGIGIGTGMTQNSGNMAQIASGREMEREKMAQQMAIARMQEAGANARNAATIAAANGKGQTIKPSDLDQMYKDEHKRVEETFWGSGGVGGRRGSRPGKSANEISDIAKNNVTIRLLGMGISPPQDFMSATQRVQVLREKGLAEGAGRAVAPSIPVGPGSANQVATPGNTGGVAKPATLKTVGRTDPRVPGPGATQVLTIEELNAKARRAAGL